MTCSFMTTFGLFSIHGEWGGEFFPVMGCVLHGGFQACGKPVLHHPRISYIEGIKSLVASGLVRRVTMGAMHKHISETTGLQRLGCGLLAGLLTAALPLPLAWQLRGLLGWCAGIAVYLLLAWWLCMRFDGRRTRERAQAQD